MLIIKARNVNDAYAEALWRLPMEAVIRETRGGKVMAHPTPVVTIYEQPHERMLFDANRDANPFFHIFEGLWMLAGRNDAKWISQFSSNIAQFAEEDGLFHGAYGYRWRQHWPMEDQLSWLICHLISKPNSRRAVVQMYDPAADHETEEWVPKDIPCNTAIYFAVQDGKLNMTVTNRSNDLVWGCYGANAVHMSMLMEFVANAVGVPMGTYYQFSNDWHMYERHWHLTKSGPPDSSPDPYPQSHVVLTDRSNWARDLDEITLWVDHPDEVLLPANPFLVSVANPMLEAWNLYKSGHPAHAVVHAGRIVDGAVRQACVQWLKRRVR